MVKSHRSCPLVTNHSWVLYINCLSITCLIPIPILGSPFFCLSSDPLETSNLCFFYNSLCQPNYNKNYFLHLLCWDESTNTAICVSRDSCCLLPTKLGFLHDYAALPLRSQLKFFVDDFPIPNLLFPSLTVHWSCNIFGHWLIITNISFSHFFLTVLKSGWSYRLQIIKNPCANAGDVGLIPGSGRSSEQGNGTLLQYSWLENFMDRGYW